MSIKSASIHHPPSITNPPSIMDSLMASYDDRRLSFNRGEKITGEVISINNTEIVLDLRAKAEGVLNKKDLSADIANNLKIGDRLDVFVVFPENESGQVVVSSFKQENIGGRSRMGRKIDLSKWQKFIQGKETGATFSGEITEVNRGGVIVSLDGIRGFVPSSQVSLRNLSNPSELTGNNLKLTVIEVDPDNNKLVFSSRLNLTEAEKKELLEFEVGVKVTGKIIAVTPFGLFVAINSTPGESKPTPGVSEVIEGIIYPQETTWSAPEEIDLNKNYKAGTEIEAKIINIDENLGRLNLSLRQMEEDPFGKIAEKFTVDDVVTGVITNITQNGVIVALQQSTSGELASRSGSEPTPEVIGFLPIEKTKGQIYKIGQKTNFLVDSIDAKNRRINLAPFLTSTVGLIYK